MKKLIGRIKGRDVLYLIGISFSFCIFGNLLLSFFLDITDNPITDSLNNTTDDKLIWLMISIVFIAPILEELIFRGFVLWLVKKLTNNEITNLKYSTAIAVVVQAILFGISHMNIVQGIYAVFAGLVLGYLMIRYETLLAPMFVHLLLNLNALIFGFILIGITDPKEKAFVILITFAIFALSMYRIIKKGEEVV